MKKLLKSTSLFIITIVLTFGFNLNVYAADCGELDSSTCRVGDRGVIKVARYTSSSEATTTTKYQYRETNKYAMTNNNTIDANRPSYGTKNLPEGYFYKYYDNITGIYCMDPGNKAGTGIYAQRFLLDSKDQLHIQAMDYAILEILTDGGSGVAQISNWNDYWARTTAVRAVVATFGNEYKTTTMQDLSQYYAILTAINTWLNESSVAYDNLNTALRNAKKENAAIGTLQAKSAFDDHTDYSFEANSTAMAKAHRYYTYALEAATDYIESATDGPKWIWDENPITLGDIKTENKSDGTWVQRDVIHTVKFSGLPQEDSENAKNELILNKEIKFSEGVKYDGLQINIVSVKINDDVYGEGGSLSLDSILGTNILTKYDFSEENEIIVTVRLGGWKTNKRNQPILKCGQQPIEYYLDGNYSGEKLNKFSDFVGVIWYAGTSKEQRFISVEKAVNGDSQKNLFVSPAEALLIEACSCDDLLEACINSKNINSNECKELEAANCGECTWLEAQCELGNNSACEEFALVCDAKCEATFTTFECCDEQGDLIVSELDDHEVKIEGPDENKLCFVTKVDAQINGNNYSGVSGVNDQNGNSYGLASMKENKYCSVSCKEDYVMTMPTAKLVNAGRYFTFKAKVEGTKTCFTNTINIGDINTPGSYVYDIYQAQREMIAYYNLYKEFEAYKKASKDDDGKSGEYYSSCSVKCGGGCPGSCEKEYPEPTEYYRWAETDDVTYPQYQYSTNDVNKDTGVILGRIVNKDNQLRMTSAYDSDKNSCSRQRRSCTTKSDGSHSCRCYSSSCSCSHFDDWKIFTFSDGFTGKKVETYDRHWSKGSLSTYINDAYSYYGKKLDEAVKKYEKIREEFDDCTDDKWTSEVNYEPEVYYDYEETYLNEFGLVGEMVETISDKDVDDEWLCKGKNAVSKDYNSCSNGNLSSRNSSLEARKYAVCNKNTCVNNDVQVSNASYAKKTSEITATYKPATLFYNIYPSGEITINESDDNVAIENGLPVALNTKRGIYKYTVNIENLGEFYDIDSKNNLGRYVGGKTAVVDKDKLEYACSYLVNMPITNEDRLVCDFDDGCKGEDCISDCIGPNCDNICEGVDCVADCIGAGCIYDEDAGSSIVEKTVSLNNLFPTGTNSYNWSKTANDKAKTTVTAIEEKGNKVYDETPILSITLDASSARKIKEYNNDAEFDGGYSNSTISCYKLNGHEEVACYSSFITDLLDDEYGKVVNDNSLIKNDKYRTVSDNNTEYFTPWGGSVSEDNMIGPAWK